MLIATPNLCLDITVRLPELVPGSVVRSTDTVTTAGGKGVNAARAVLALGSSARLIGFLPDDDGDRLVRLLADDGTELHAVPVPGVLRVASVLLEDSGRVTVINGRGPEIDEERWDQYTENVARSLRPSDILLCCGSLPPGVPVDGYRELVDIAHAAGLPVMVDAAPAVLAATLASRPDLVSPNLSEAEAMLLGTIGEQVQDEGGDIPQRASAAATALYAAGARRAVVTAGAAGAALCSAQGSWWLPAPAVRLVNPIGAGDCFAAGASLALLEGRSDVEVVRAGMAAGSASCETGTGGRLHRERAAELYAIIGPAPLPPSNVPAEPDPR